MRCSLSDVNLFYSGISIKVHECSYQKLYMWSNKNIEQFSSGLTKNLNIQWCTLLVIQNYKRPKSKNRSKYKQNLARLVATTALRVFIGLNICFTGSCEIRWWTTPGLWHIKNEGICFIPLKSLKSSKRSWFSSQGELSGIS